MRHGFKAQSERSAALARTSLGLKANAPLDPWESDTEEGSGDGDSTNHEVREQLHDEKIDVTDRMFKTGHIGHNKFVVYVKNNVAKALLCGSTNWTPTGLCAQSNNSIIIESPDLAAEYLAYWKWLKKDTDDADGDAKELQHGSLRTADKKANKPHPLKNEAGEASGNVRVWFSPNTKQKSARSRKDWRPVPRRIVEIFSAPRYERAKSSSAFTSFSLTSSARSAAR